MFVVLCIQQCAILSPVACPTLQYFSTLSYKRQDLFWFSLQLLSETFLILRRAGGIKKNVYRSWCEVPLILVRFSKYTQIYNFIEIRPMGTELSDADGRTNRHNQCRILSFWVILRRLNFMCRHFGTLSPILIGGVIRKFEIGRHDKVARQKAVS